MLIQSLKSKYPAIVFILVSLLTVTGALKAQPLHSKFVSIPYLNEEALTWCGPASGQIVMASYPTGACNIPQEDVWMSILSHKVEPDWDTDPEGLRQAMIELCPPIGSWSLRAWTTPEKLMGSVTYWMTSSDYPAPLLLDTAPHNSYSAHAEHWVVIWGVVTDVDPTSTPVTSVDLHTVCYHDPGPEELGGPTTTACENGDIWYDSMIQSVSKVSSSFFGKYVAIVEPPEKTIVATAPPEILVGVLIKPDDALRYASKWIAERKFDEMERFKYLKNAKPLPPLLVNQDYGGYYIVPYSADGKTVGISVLVNAYNGNFQSIAAFQPINYISKKEAIDLAIKYLGDQAKLGPQPEPPDAALIYPKGERVVSRYFPIWQVSVGRKVVGVSQRKKIFPKMPVQDFFLKVPFSKPASLAWDGKQMWTVDIEKNKLHSIDSRTGAIIKTLDVQLKQPKGLVFDGNRLWVGDTETMKIHAIDLESGQISASIPIQIPKEKGYKAFEDLAWDGQYLWTAISAGFSSSYNKIDPNSGEIIRSMFADCIPRGIEIKDGVLWSVCYNGDNLPAKIERRQIMDKDHEMLRSRQYIKTIELKEASGLVYDGTYLWTMDRKLKRVFKIYPKTPAKN